MKKILLISILLLTGCSLLFNSDKYNPNPTPAVKPVVEEVKDINEKKGKDFNIAEAIFGQLPFFACKRFLYSDSALSDINRYSYCDAFNVPAYAGHYGSHPKKWIDKSFFIRNIMNKKREKDGEKQGSK